MSHNERTVPPEGRASSSERDAPDGAGAGPEGQGGGPPVSRDGRRRATARERAEREEGLASVPFESLVAEVIRRMGEDPEREGLRRTPGRVVEAYRALTEGYRLSPEAAVGGGIFQEHHHNMVMVRDIEMYSLCEHHLLPFFGKVHVGYIPNGRIVGLSKVARLVEVFARRLQVQERLTEEIAGSLSEIVEPEGVGVVIEAHHLCMMMRGVEKQNSTTITSAMRGSFLDDARTRDEFLRLCVRTPRPGS